MRHAHIVDNSRAFDHIPRFSLPNCARSGHHSDMVTFSLSNLTWRGTLRQRRGLAFARRLAIACCAGAAVFATLQCVVAGVGTQPIVVATRAIERGAALTSGDVRIVEIPASTIWSGSLSRVDQAAGQIAQVPLARGQPVLASMIAVQPVIPDGYTTIDVSLASSSGKLIAGDIVDLVTNLDCSTADSEPADSDDSNDSDTASNTADDANTTNPADSGSAHNTTTDDANASNDAGNNTNSTTGDEAAQQQEMELTAQEGEQQTANEPNDHTLNPSTEPSASGAGQAVQPQATRSPTARSSATHAQLASPTTVPAANSDDMPTARQPCTLASAALAMAAPRHNDLTGGTVLSLAMPPEDALAVMAAQETNAIMAVTVAR